MNLVEVMDKIDAENYREKLLLRELAKQAIITSQWMHAVGFAGRGDNGSKILRQLDKAIQKLEE